MSVSDDGTEGTNGSTGTGACDSPNSGGTGLVATELSGGAEVTAVGSLGVNFNADDAQVIDTTSPFGDTGNAGNLYFCMWQRLDTLTNCGTYAGDCLEGVGDSSYSASGDCGADGRCPGDQGYTVPDAGEGDGIYTAGEYWEITETT